MRLGHRSRIAEPVGLPAFGAGRSPPQECAAGFLLSAPSAISRLYPIESGSEWRCLIPQLLPSDGVNACSSCLKHRRLGIVCQGFLMVVSQPPVVLVPLGNGHGCDESAWKPIPSKGMGASRVLLKETFCFISSIFFHRMQNIRVDVCSYIKVFMAQDLLDHLEVYSHTPEQC